jgi:hypothetical protein
MFCSFPEVSFPGVSAVPAHGDRDGVVATGADGQRVRVVGEDDTRGPQLVDQASGLGRGGELPGAVAVRRAAAGKKDGDSGQVGQDLVFTDVGVSRLSGAGRGGAGVAVAAPVGGLAVRPC